MNYLWTDYNPRNTYVIAADNRDINSECQTISGDIRRISAFGRLQDVFTPLLAQEWSKDAPQREHVEDLFLHVLAWLDNLSGLRPSTLAQMKIRRHILAGDYGSEAGKSFNRLEKSEQKALLRLLQQRQETDDEYACFFSAIRTLYPCSCAYFNEDGGKAVVELPIYKSAVHEERIGLLEDLFLPVEADPIRYFWGRKLARIENPETMRIGRITLF